MAYDSEYYTRYSKKNLFGLEKGERPFLYAFWIRKLKKLLNKDARVLDVGCGAGYFLKRLEKNFKVDAMDVSQDALDITKGKVFSPL